MLQNSTCGVGRVQLRLSMVGRILNRLGGIERGFQVLGASAGGCSGSVLQIVFATLTLFGLFIRADTPVISSVTPLSAICSAYLFGFFRFSDGLVLYRWLSLKQWNQREKVLPLLCVPWLLKEPWIFFKTLIRRVRLQITSLPRPTAWTITCSRQCQT